MPAPDRPRGRSCTFDRSQWIDHDGAVGSGAPSPLPRIRLDRENKIMTARILCFALALAGLAAVVTTGFASQKADPPPEPKGQAATASDHKDDSESLIETWVRYAMPTEHHKLLAKMTGKWHMAVKYRMNSETPVVESEGTCERKWILGKRFLLEEFDGGSLGLPFQGLAIYGYDAFEQKYTSIWVDTTSTAVTTSLGVCEESCDLIRFTGRHGDPWSGKKRSSHGVTRLVSDNRHVLELYEPDNSGTEFRVLEIVYTRKSSRTEPGSP